MQAGSENKPSLSRLASCGPDHAEKQPSWPSLESKSCKNKGKSGRMGQRYSKQRNLLHTLYDGLQRKIALAHVKCICAETQLRKRRKTQPQTGKNKHAVANLASNAPKSFGSCVLHNIRRYRKAKKCKFYICKKSNKKDKPEESDAVKTRLPLVQIIQRTSASSFNMSKSSSPAHFT